MRDNILILLSTFNGAKYLSELLDSLSSQTYKKFTIIARDDGSSDETLDILKAHKIKLIHSQGNVGVKKSFGILLNEALKYEDNEYIMFCDQDDVWLSDKIEKTYVAMKKLEQDYPQKPLLMHTDLQVTDEELHILDNSFWHYEHIEPSINSLNRLLIQNTITGCTMMINTKLASLVKEIPADSNMHDWWFGLVAAQFGKIGYIKSSTIKYRQHKSNDTGAKRFNYINILKKAIKIFSNDELHIKHRKKNISQAKIFLKTYERDLDAYTVEMLHNFIDIQDKSFIDKRAIILRYKLLKQGYIRNIGLLARI